MAGFPELPLEPRDPEIVGHCKWCGDEIYRGEAVFSGDVGMIHAECIGEMLLERLGASFVAERCGYRKGVA